MANYNVDNIEVNLIATATKAIQAFDQAIGKGKELEKTLQSINTLTRKTTSNTNNMNKAFKGLSVNKNVVKNIESVQKGIKNVDNQANSLSKTLNKVFDVSRLAYYFNKMMNFGNKTLGASAEFGENYNLFNVAMDESIDKGMAFQEQMSGLLHMNISDTMRYQGFFKSLTESLGIAEDGAYRLSENLTKLTFDLSSLYNVDFGDMYTKVQSGMVGQTKPLRSVGIDVTQQTLQGYLDNMGIERNVIQLSQAEKVLLRYIAILDQSQIAHGDFAKTIESPSNQIRTFKELLKQLYVWVGNVFIGAFGKVMPYINGFVMVLVEMAKTLAYVFGFDLAQYEYAGWNGMSEDVLDLTEGLDDVGTSADKTSGKLKKMQGLLGFNEINNIKTPTEDSGAGGVGGLGGASIYDDLLGQIKDYDNLMSNVRTKASDIRNKIFDWLGFTYDLNAITGELTNLKWGGWSEMSTGAKVLASALAIITGLKVVGTIMGIVSSFAKLKTVLVGAGVTSAGASAGGGVIAGLLAFPTTIKLALASFAGITSGTITWGATLSALTLKIGAVVAGIGTFFGATTAMGALLVGGGVIVGGLALAYGAVKAFQWGMEESVKSVDAFNGVSKETKEVLEPLYNQFINLDETITQLDWSNEIISEDDVKDVKANLGSITTYIKSNFVSKIEKSKKTIEDTNMFEGMDISKRQDILKRLDDHLATQEKSIEDAENEIYKIMETASNEKRSLTDDEVKRINELKKGMYQTAVRELSANQKEQEAILTNLKFNTEKLEAEKAISIVNKAKETRDKVIAEAGARYNEEIAEAGRLKELGIITEAEYNTMTKNAKTNYDKQVNDANKAYTGIVNEAKRGMGDLANTVDWDKGKVKTNWQKFTDGIKGAWNGIIKWFSSNPLKPSISNSELRISTNLDKANTHGSIKIQAYATGGFPEDGLFFANSNELVGKFSNGKTAVANNDQITTGIEQAVYRAMSNALGSQASPTNNIVVNVGTREVAREVINYELEQKMVRG